MLAAACGIWSNWRKVGRFESPKKLADPWHQRENPNGASLFMHFGYWSVAVCQCWRSSYWVSPVWQLPSLEPLGSQEEVWHQNLRGGEQESKGQVKWGLPFSWFVMVLRMCQIPGLLITFLIDLIESPGICPHVHIHPFCPNNLWLASLPSGRFGHTSIYGLKIIQICG